jgi:hypothetical protein
LPPPTKLGSALAGADPLPRPERGVADGAAAVANVRGSTSHKRTCGSWRDLRGTHEPLLMLAWQRVHQTAPHAATATPSKDTSNKLVRWVIEMIELAGVGKWSASFRAPPHRTRTRHGGPAGVDSRCLLRVPLVGASGVATRGIWLDLTSMRATEGPATPYEPVLREKARRVVEPSKMPNRQPDRLWGGRLGVGAPTARLMVGSREGGGRV